MAAGSPGTLGFQVDIRETEGHPVVIGHHPGPGDDATHVLYYGHYDVQPPDPLEEWDNPPFEPTLVDGPHGRRMVARGAVDDKGQLMMWFEALRAWHAENGDLPVAVTVLLEGEEEVGSATCDRSWNATGKSWPLTSAWSATRACGTSTPPPSPPPCAGCSTPSLPAAAPVMTCTPASMAVPCATR